MPLREAAATFFVELHGLLFGGDAGRKLGGVSASDLRKSLMGGRAAFLFLRRPSMGALSMTMNTERKKKSRNEIPKILIKVCRDLAVSSLQAGERVLRTHDCARRAPPMHNNNFCAIPLSH